MNQHSIGMNVESSCLQGSLCAERIALCSIPQTECNQLLKSTCSNSQFAYELQDPKALGAAACSAVITCGKGTLPLLRMIVASSVLPELQ